jgi:hypothetical protein
VPTKIRPLCGYEGIPNSIAVALELSAVAEDDDGDGTAAAAALGELCVHASTTRHVNQNLSASSIDGERGASGASGDLSSSLYGATIGRAQLGRRVSLGSGSSQLHTLRVDYEPMGGDAGVATIRGGTAGRKHSDAAMIVNAMLSVYVDDAEARSAPALSVPLHLPSCVRLDDGRAYVGICSHLRSSTDSSNSLLLSSTASSAVGGSSSECGMVKLQSWEFTANKRYQSPTDRSSAAGNRIGDMAAFASSIHNHTTAQRSGYDALLFAENALAASAGWAGLGLAYKVDFPLHLILTQDALGQYNRLFAFLFRFRRVGSALERLWPELNRARYKSLSREVEKVWLTPLRTLRSKMAFVLHNLETHVHVDVIAVEHSAMQVAMKQACDFDAVRTTHERYLRALRRRCYLDVDCIAAAIARVLDASERYCFLLEAFKSCDDIEEEIHETAVRSRRGRKHVNRRPQPPSVMAERIPSAAVEQLAEEFESSSSFLFVLLEKSGGAGGGPTSTAELLLRLNFNGFMSAAAAASVG